MRCSAWNADLVVHHYLSSHEGHSSTGASSKPSQHLRKLLRAHLQKGQEAAMACCMWALAIAEGSSPHTQLQMLSDGLLDVVCDSVSRVLLVCCPTNAQCADVQIACSTPGTWPPRCLYYIF